MKPTLPLLLCLLCTTYHAFSSTLPKDFESHFRQIQSLAENPQKDFDKALLQIKEYVNNNPQLLNTLNKQLFEYFYTATKLQYENVSQHKNTYYEHAIAIAKQHDLQNLKVAEIFYWSGVICANQRKLGKSESYLFEALDIASNENLASKSFIAKIYSKLGLTYIWMGSIERALDMLHTALNKYENIPNIDKTEVVVVYNNIGIANNNIQKYDESIRNYEIALDIILNAGLDEKNPYLLAGTYDHLSTPLTELDRLDEALLHVNKGLEIRKENAKGPSNLVSDSYDGVARLYLKNKNYNKAIEYHKKSLSIKEQFYEGLHPDIAYSYFQMGKVYFETEQYDLAQEEFITCMNMLEKVSTKKYLLYPDAYIRLAKTYKNQGDLVRALEILEEVLLLKNTIRREQQTSNRTLSSLKSKEFSITEEALEICFELYMRTGHEKYLETAFNIFEEKQASRLLDALHASAVEAFGKIPKGELAKGDSIKLLVTNSEKTYFEANTSNKDANDIKAAQEEMIRSKEKWYRYTEEIKKKYPDFYNLKLNPDHVKLAEVQFNQKENESIIEYYVGENHLYILLISKEQVVFKQVDYKISLPESVQKIRQAIKSDEGVSGESISNFAENAHSLYQQLIEPIYNSHLVDKDLCFITDGILGYVPFDILLTHQPTALNGYRSLPYLLKKNNISYAYSANLLNTKEVVPRANNILALSPDFTTIKKDSIGNYIFKELKYSNEEVDLLQNIYDADVLKGTEASIETFINTAKDYNILHLSTHGKADDRVGDFCYLTFSATNEERDNYPLYVRDLYNLDLSANMVVLSACETGIGELREGEGIISLGRGFTYAGAKSIISSLWNINDRSTKEIIQGFYSYLEKGLQKSHSLRKAKLDYLENSINPNPKYWASFTAYGNMDPMQIGKSNNTRNNHWFIGIAILGFIFGGGWILYKR